MSHGERLDALEARQDNLELSWEEVLAKLLKRVQREAATKQRELDKVLEAPPPPDVTEGQPEALPALEAGDPVKAELRRRAFGLNRRSRGA